MLRLSWITRSGLAHIPWCQGSFRIVTNGPAGSVVSFIIRQALKCKHLASTQTLTMWLPCFNCALLRTTKFLGVFRNLFSIFIFYFLPTFSTQRKQRSLLDPRPSAEFSGKMRKFLRFLAEYLAASAFLCFHYIFDSYITCLTLSFNTVYMYFHSHFLFCIYSFEQ